MPGSFACRRRSACPRGGQRAAGPPDRAAVHCSRTGRPERGPSRIRKAAARWIGARSGASRRISLWPSDAGRATCPAKPYRETHGYPQYRDHRPRRPRQDHAGGRASEAVGRLPREPGRRRTRHGLERPRTRARDHDPRQVHLASNGRARGSTSSTRPATPTSAARWSGSCRWWMASCLLVDAAEGPMPQTKFVTVQGAGAGPAPHRGAEQGRQAGCRAGPGAERGVRPVRALDADDEQLDFPHLYALGPRRLGGRGPRRAAQGPVARCST